MNLILSYNIMKNYFLFPIKLNVFIILLYINYMKYIKCALQKKILKEEKKV